MSEVQLEMTLTRRSGVLASIVASLGQAGLALQSQKVRDDEDPPILVIDAEGEMPDLGELVDRINATRGVDRLLRVELDGEVLLEEGEPVVTPEPEPPETPHPPEDDQAGLEAAGEAPRSGGHDGLDLAEEGVESAAAKDQEVPVDDAPETALDPGLEPEGDVQPQPAQELEEAPETEALEDNLSEEDLGKTEDETADDPERAEKALRRRRRRRR
ncbi:MAG: hypothetical protein R3323_06675 [Wenzhouxiangellaceae bacterium]|nr:hypothetical protein [Wenzhouxiangellaceae bacterium]